MTDTLLNATNLDSAVSMALARVTIDTLRSISPEIERSVQDRIRQEVERLRMEADLYQDPLSNAAAEVLSENFDIRDEACVD